MLSKLYVKYQTSKNNRLLIKEQIKKEEEYIKENTKEIEYLMQDEICLLNLKVYGHYDFLDRCFDLITYHQKNIEKLKRGDMKLCLELVKWEIEKEAELNERGCGGVIR